MTTHYLCAIKTCIQCQDSHTHRDIKAKAGGNSVNHFTAEIGPFCGPFYGPGQGKAGGYFSPCSSSPRPAMPICWGLKLERMK